MSLPVKIKYKTVT